MLRPWLRWLLGTEIIIERQRSLSAQIGAFEHACYNELTDLKLEITKLRNELNVEMYDEFSPKRRKLSDEIAQRTRDRLEADAKARNLAVYGTPHAPKEE